MCLWKTHLHRSNFYSPIKWWTILQSTNKNMQPVIEKFSDPQQNGSTKYSHVKFIDRVDIEAFIDILYLRAAFRPNIHDREVIWDHEKAHDLIGATMALHRFKLICRLIKKHETTFGRLTNLQVWENYLRTWMNGMREWGILFPC